MLIGLYRSYRNLPFGKEPRNADELFFERREEIGSRRIKTLDGQSLCAKETYIWSVLTELHSTPLPVMAHISAFPFLGGEFHISSFNEIQLTPMPTETVDGIPVSVKDGKAIVRFLWKITAVESPFHDFKTLLWEQLFEVVRDAEQKIAFAERVIRESNEIVNLLSLPLETF